MRRLIDWYYRKPFWARFWMVFAGGMAAVFYITLVLNAAWP